MLLVSPTSLIGLLRTMELGWRQERMVAEAAEIADAAGTLHARFAKFLSDFDKVGKRLDLGRRRLRLRGRLDGAAGCCRSCARSRSLGVAPGKEIEPPEPVEITVREITAPELREASDAAVAPAAGL